MLFLNSRRSPRSLALTRSFALAGCVLLVSACATRAPDAPALAGLEVPPAFAAAEVADAKAANSEEIRPEEPWWATFDDPVLSALVKEALATNHDLAAAAALVDGALAAARIEGAARKPQVNASLGGSRREQIFVGLPIPGNSGVLSSTSTSWSLGLDISWEADLWGRLRAGGAAALAGSVAAEEDLRAARLSIAAQTAKAWFGLIEAEAQVELAMSTTESRRRSTERLASRYRLGMASALDLRSARASQAQAEQAVEARQRQLQGARRRLQSLLGRYPDGKLASQEQSPITFPTLPPAVPPGLPAELVRRRPDLRATENRLRAAGFRVAAAQAALYPGLSLTAGTGTTSDRIGDLLDGDFSVWSLTGGLLAPLFQGGRLRAGIDLATADHQGQLAIYASSILRAFSEVEAALADEALLRNEEEALATVAAESVAARDLATNRFQAGLGDFLRVLDSERQAFQAESLWLTLKRQRLDRRVDLHLALGGDLAVAKAPASEEDLAVDEDSAVENGLATDNHQALNQGHQPEGTTADAARLLITIPANQATDR